MPITGAAEVTTLAEALAVGLDTEMYEVNERRNTYITHLEIDSDLYKISASSTSERRNYLVESAVYCRHLVLHQPAC